MNAKATIAVAVAAIVAVLGGVGATLAYAGPPTPSPSPSSSPTAAPSSAGPQDKKGHRRPLLRRALHGEVTLAGPQHRVVAFQRGEVTKVNSSALTARSADGFTATYQLDSDVRVRQNREAASLSAVKVGTRVRVVATKEGSTLTARRIVLVN